MNYTKGEWKVEVPEIEPQKINIKSEWRNTDFNNVINVRSICRTFGYCDSDKEELSNAHLIAAAPDMYEALKSLRTLLQDSDSIRIQAHGIGDEFGAYNIFEKADKALAKAEGKHD